RVEEVRERREVLLLHVGHEVREPLSQRSAARQGGGLRRAALDRVVEALEGAPQDIVREIAILGLALEPVRTLEQRAPIALQDLRLELDEEQMEVARVLAQVRAPPAVSLGIRLAHRHLELVEPRAHALQRMLDTLRVVEAAALEMRHHLADR